VSTSSQTLRAVPDDDDQFDNEGVVFDIIFVATAAEDFMAAGVHAFAIDLLVTLARENARQTSRRDDGRFISDCDAGHSVRYSSSACHLWTHPRMC
jgi:hypothetical protein